MEKKRELLDDLAAQTGCQYLSDLHLQNKRVKVVQAVRHLSADSYSAAQWKRQRAIFGVILPPLPMRNRGGNISLRVRADIASGFGQNKGETNGNKKREAS